MSARCPCGTKLPTFPSPYIVAGREFCSERCGEKVEGQIHYESRNEPAEQWAEETRARRARWADADREADRARRAS